MKTQLLACATALALSTPVHATVQFVSSRSASQLSDYWRSGCVFGGCNYAGGGDLKQSTISTPGANTSTASFVSPALSGNRTVQWSNSASQTSGFVNELQGSFANDASLSISRNLSGIADSQASGGSFGLYDYQFTTDTAVSISTAFDYVTTLSTVAGRILGDSQYTSYSYVSVEVFDLIGQTRVFGKEFGILPSVNAQNVSGSGSETISLGAGKYDLVFRAATHMSGVSDAAASSTATSSISGNFTIAPAAPSVPEPATWTLMIAGIGLVGASARRRRVSPCTA